MNLPLVRIPGAAPRCLRVPEKSQPRPAGRYSKGRALAWLGVASRAEKPTASFFTQRKERNDETGSFIVVRDCAWPRGRGSDSRIRADHLGFVNRLGDDDGAASLDD